MNVPDPTIDIQLIIRGVAPSIPVAVRTRPLLLGRADPNASQQPDIDLTKHNAHEAGVSRLHAQLQLYDDKVCVEDLGSRNGTYVNDERLAPYVEHPLYDGDWLRLGKFMILINYL
jgi:pSer/pThr/pTyr-binding forkhead associated (FHA) protein